MRLFPVVVLASVLCFCVAARNSTSEQYDNEDAYEIYSLLLPDEQSYGLAKSTVVIQEETVASVKLNDDCLTPQAVREFKDAIEDYKRHNEPMVLQRKFKIDKPYELVSTKAIETLIKNYDWNSFYKQYPNSGGIIRMSAVGFNRQKTLAIVDTGSTCNNQCGRGSLHLLKKIDGKWKPATGVQCVVVS
jgi:hypothetical protein